MTVSILRQYDIDLLRAGKKRIEDPAHWCTGYYVQHDGPDGSCRFCAKGAVFAVSSDPQSIAIWSTTDNNSSRLLDDAANDLFGEMFGDLTVGVVFVNDELRDHAKVMQVYDRAIEMGEERLAAQETAA